MKNLTKHFAQITKKKDIRPILAGINYNHIKDQLEATDSHRLLMINANYNLNDSFVFNPLTLERIEGNYPNTERLIPEVQDNLFRAGEVDTTLLKILAAYKKENLSLELSDGAMSISNEKDNIIATIPVTINHSHEYEKTYINASYLYDALLFIADYGKEYPDARINLTMVTRVRPINFSNFEFNYIVTPVRVWWLQRRGSYLKIKITGR